MTQERLSSFEEICQIGEGSFGTVFKVRHRKTNDIYVLKKVSTVGMSYEDRKDARQEFEIHKTLKNEYIVKYESHFSDKGFICILLEFMDGGDVGQYLKKLNNRLLPEK
jgi:serine/threonine protein kinase